MTTEAKREQQVMRTISFSQYGPAEVLQPQMNALPEPGDDEVRVRVMSSSVTRGDVLVRAGKPFAIRLFFGLFKPRNPLLGHEFSGIVEQCGKKVSRFKKGDKVMGSLGTHSGAYAEYLVTGEDNLAIIPENTGYEGAAVSQVGGLTALWFLNQMNILPGQHILIFGASGSVGSSALQLAIAKGARVTAVCGPDAIPYMKKLGAVNALDYHHWNPETSGQKFDGVFDAAGKLGLKRAQHILRKKGSFATTAYSISPLLRKRLLKEKAVRTYCGMMKETPENREELREHLASGAFKPLIDRCFHWNQMSEAHHYVETGRKLGNVPVRFFTH